MPRQHRGIPTREARSDTPAPTRRTICNGVEITTETVFRTRRHFAELSLASAREYYGPGKRGEQLGKTAAEMARFRARDWHNLKAGLRGESDHTLTFIQRALYLQTGDCPALLA